MDDVFDQVTEEAITVTSTGISRCRIAVDHVREMRNVAEFCRVWSSPRFGPRVESTARGRRVGAQGAPYVP
jgi:hypothetical protein